MPLLDALLEKRVRLVDYEAITRGGVRGGERLVAFGYYAGVVGAVDLLRGLGERCLCLGFATPLTNVAATWQYPSLRHAYDAVRAAGDTVRALGLPAPMAPFVVGVTGLCGAEGRGERSGRVACGARDVLAHLGVKWLPAEGLGGALAALSGRARTHELYAVALDMHHVVAKRQGGGGGSPPRASPCASRVATATTPTGFTVATACAFAPVGEGFEGEEDAEEEEEEEEEPGLLTQDGASFDRAHYKAHPEDYAPVFHTRLAPHLSALMHCSYWESKFPRLLTAAQARRLSARGALRLLAVGDITCDVKGAVEFMEPTTMQRPFFVYQPLTGAVHWDMQQALGEAGAGGEPVGRGVLYHAMDHLPSECPRDATNHFGTCLVPLLPALVANCAALRRGAPPPPLPAELAGAVICAGGALSETWAHIAALRAAKERARAPSFGGANAAGAASGGGGGALPRKETFATVELRGHLFDTGFLNKTLSLIEDSHAYARMLDCVMGRSRAEVTQVRLQVFAPGARGAGAPQGGDGLLHLLCRLKDMADGADMQLSVDGERSHLLAALAAATAAARGGGGGGGGGSPRGASPRAASPTPAAPPAPPLLPAPPPAIAGAPRAAALVLGSGFVAVTCVEALLRRPGASVVIASAVLPEAAALAARWAGGATAAHVDVGGDEGGLRRLVAGADVVVSLVPAHLHPHVVRAAIAERVQVVTASYVHAEVAALHGAARAAGVTVVAECGLDPGMDHLSACALLDGLRARGGAVTRFRSVCGGLPAPEAASNPLGYKWSWSPRGALAAMGNAAKWLEDGREAALPAGALLRHAAPFSLAGLPAFALEMLPNRDSLPYVHTYGVGGPALSFFQRGTLRYAGFSARMGLLAEAGLLCGVGCALPAALAARRAGAAPPFREVLAAVTGAPADAGAPALAAALLRAAPASAAALSPRQAEDFLAWLGLDTPVPLPPRGEDGAPPTWVPLDALAALLAPHPGMALGEGADVALMQHEVVAAFPGGAVERHTCTLVERGRDGLTAMARTVGYTAAAAAALLLEDPALRGLGVLRPLTPEWYKPMLRALEKDGMQFRETVVRE